MKNQKKLRKGITTGTCAAAAAEAAMALLLLNIQKETVLIYTPKGITVSVPVMLSYQDECRAEFIVVKDSGDDPDVTNHAEIYARVERISEDVALEASVFWDERYPGLFLEGGIGIGRVTKDGLEQRKGQAAINVVPRNMIFEAAGAIYDLAECQEKILITIFVPKGEELSKRTFNLRLGIEGGISILGTSGILEPMSEKAIIDTIETEIRQFRELEGRNLLVTPGNYGQSYASEYLHLDLTHSIKCSNYIGDTIDLAVAYGMETFLLVGNVGKLVKLAAGIMNTHSKVADGRCEIFAVHAVLCGADRRIAEQIMTCINTDEILTILEKCGLRQAVMECICKEIHEHFSYRTGGQMRFGVVLFSEKYGYLGETTGVREIVNVYR